AERHVAVRLAGARFARTGAARRSPGGAGACRNAPTTRRAARLARDGLPAALARHGCDTQLRLDRARGRRAAVSQSARSAIAGSTAAERRAGTTQATSAAAPNTAAASRYTDGSRGDVS